MLFIKLYSIVIFIGNENKQMWFASYIKGGEAYGRSTIIIINNKFTRTKLNRGILEKAMKMGNEMGGKGADICNLLKVWMYLC